MPYCRKCKKTKSETDFEPHKRTETGFDRVCIECKNYSGITRKCVRCQIEQPIEYYNKRRKNICKICNREYMNKYMRDNHLKHEEYRKQYNDKNKDIIRTKHREYYREKFIEDPESSLRRLKRKKSDPQYHKDYEKAPKRRLYVLKKSLALAKREKTIEKLKKQIEELELLINQKQ